MPEEVTQEDIDIFTDDSTKPASNWFKFENVGDGIQGVLVDDFEHEGTFGLQHVYVVQKPNGEEVNVSLKTTTHAVQIRQLKAAAHGDIVGFKLRELVDTGKKNPAKSIEVRIKRLSQIDSAKKVGLVKE